MGLIFPDGWGQAIGVKRFCFPDGPLPCETMLIGEGPGKQEAAHGLSFIGPTGDTLNTYLWRLGWTRGEDVYTTNLVKYRVADINQKDAPPSLEDIERDWPILKWEIETGKPRFIIALGGAATRALVTTPHPMDAMNGRPIVSEEYHPRLLALAHQPEFVIPNIHPAAGLRDPDLGGRCWQGLAIARKFVRSGEHPFLFDYPKLRRDGIYRRATLDDIRALAVYDMLFIDTEGSRKNPWMLSVSAGNGGWGLIVYAEDKEMLAELNRLVQDRVVVLHNALHDLSVLRAMGVHVKRFIDTMVLAFLTNMEPQGLKGLSWRTAGFVMSEYEDVVEPYSLKRAVSYLEDIKARLEAGELMIPVASKRAHTPTRRIRDTLNRLKAKQALEEEEDEEDDDAEALADPEKKVSADKKLRKWWRGGRTLAGKTKGFPPDWSALISDCLGPMPHVERKDVPAEELDPYSGRDADATCQVFPFLWRRHKEMKLEQVYEMDMAVIPMLDRMQETGMPLDLGELWKLEQELKVEHDKSVVVLREMCGPEFNPASGDHVSEFLFNKLGAPVRKLTRSGKRPATDDKVMEAIVVEALKLCGGDPKKLTGRDADIHRFVKLEQDYREQSKMLSTFITPLWGYYDPASKRVHPNWRSTRVVSGRLATFEPNLLAFPVRSAWGKRVRHCFRLTNGRILKSFDLDQIEMRVMASEAGDDALIGAFLSNQDVHWANAALIFKKGYDELAYWDEKKKEWKERVKGDKDKLRDPCKQIGFGVLYGITHVGLQAQLFLKGLDYSAQECQDLIDGWYSSHPEARRYLREAANETRRLGYVRDRWGRIRHLPGVWSELDWIRAEAERQAGNFKIQACAQGVIKRAMIRIWEKVLPELWAMGFHVQPLLQIHDELIFEMDADAEGIADHLILEAMKADSNLFLVPITSKGQAGKSWGDLK